MNKFKIISFEVPDTKRTFVSGPENYSLPNIKSGNNSTIININKNYGSLLEKWGNLFELDKKLLVAFMATESTGINRAKNGAGAIGLMQMTANAAAESIFKYKTITKYQLPSEALNFLNKKASFLTKLNSDIISSAEKTKLNALLFEPEFNIICSCIYMRWLFEKYIYLNKVIIAYNAGAYNSTLRNYSGMAPTDQLINNKSFNFETRAYLLKILGVNGFLDLIIKNNLL